MSVRLTLRPDLVLVALPPITTTRQVGTLVIVDVVPGPAIAGKVRQIGHRVRDVVVGDIVVFGSEVGEWIEIDRWPHLLLRETDIEAVLEKD